MAKRCTGALYNMMKQHGADKFNISTIERVYYRDEWELRAREYRHILIAKDGDCLNISLPWTPKCMDDMKYIMGEHQVHPPDEPVVRNPTIARRLEEHRERRERRKRELMLARERILVIAGRDPEQLVVPAEMDRPIRG